MNFRAKHTDFTSARKIRRDGQYIYLDKLAIKWYVMLTQVQ